jgi:hypothetical protein
VRPGPQPDQFERRLRGEYWTEAPGVSREHLEELVRRRGNSAEQIREEWETQLNSSSFISVRKIRPFPRYRVAEADRNREYCA